MQALPMWKTKSLSKPSVSSSESGVPSNDGTFFYGRNVNLPIGGINQSKYTLQYLHLANLRSNINPSQFHKINFLYLYNPVIQYFINILFE